jgi:hypothetical protein
MKDHIKYFNNYIYNRSLSTLIHETLIDGDFYSLSENDKPVSPIGVIYYQFYKNLEDLTEKISLNKNKIQAIVTKINNYPGSVIFGQSQFPELWNYSDEVDTLKFLLNI